ncbi:hypothetical protein JD844_000024 [Phrynosoma platyrhinos]|uniref:Carboxylesterase type B domain-containing protein n=1 Tax=Phrynosoma platyrhinos TaxID=52577 RepID=A0ABQ7SQ33_PHRPL|nr:hypothetical protein JD844_000024 [Phrynosoma platyrhinos]
MMKVSTSKMTEISKNPPSDRVSHGNVAGPHKRARPPGPGPGPGPGPERERERERAAGLIMAGLLAALWAVSALGFLAAGSHGLTGVAPEVATKYGRLRGKQAEVKGTEKWVNVFLGVPFARPPTDSLRFSPPQPPESWDGVRNATAYPAV